MTHRPQSQQSLADQLQELTILANENGLYDAADWLIEAQRRQSLDSELSTVRQNAGQFLSDLLKRTSSY